MVSSTDFAPDGNASDVNSGHE